jgi:hypothetical protein
VEPLDGHELVTRVVDSCWNFQPWLSLLGVSLKGIAIIDESAVGHSFRFVRREDLTGCRWPIEGEVQGESVRDCDVILLIKQWMNSRCLSQPPLVVLYESRLRHLLLSGPSLVLKHNKLSDTALQKYEKTAAAVEKAPWKLTLASKYLRDWCFQNKNALALAPLQMNLYTNSYMKDIIMEDRAKQLEGPQHIASDQMALADDLSFQDFAPGTPKRVTVNHASAPKPANANGPNFVMFAGLDEEDQMISDLVLPAASGIRGRKRKDNQGEPSGPVQGQDALMASPQDAPENAASDLELPEPDTGLDQQPKESAPRKAPKMKRPAAAAKSAQRAPNLIKPVISTQTTSGGWVVETRKRPDGQTDKTYRNPAKKPFRTLHEATAAGYKAD